MPPDRDLTPDAPDQCAGAIGDDEDDVVAPMDITRIQMGHDGIIVLTGYVAAGERFDNEIWTCERL